MTPEINLAEISEQAKHIVTEICASNGCVFAHNHCRLMPPGHVLHWYSRETACNFAVNWELVEEGTVHLGSMKLDGFHQNGKVVHVGDYQNMVSDIFQSSIVANRG